MASATATRRVRGRGNGMSDPLAEAYFHWLVDQVREGEGHHARTYWDLLRIMHDTEFVWLVPNDDNRIQDGLDLRGEFLTDNGRTTRVPSEQFGATSSVLEVMIGVSRRLAFIADDSAEGWAWQLLCNLELDKYHDPLSARKSRKVMEILNAMIWRTYAPDGTGGFFPLAWPVEDQRKTEIWYQMNAYVEEIHPEYGRR